MNVSSLQSRPKGWPGLAAETRIPRRLQRCNVVAASRPRTHSPGFLPRVSSIGDAIKTAMKRDNASRVLARTSPGVKFASCSLLGVAPFVSLPMLSSGDGGNSYNGSGGEGGGGDGGDGGGGGEFGRGPQEVAVVADAGEDGDVSSGEENEENEDGDESDASGGSSDSDGSSEGEEEEGDGNVADGFFCSDIKAQGLPVGEGIPTEEDLFASLNCQAGFTCSRSELSQDIKQLYNTGLFESVNAKVLPEKKGKFSVVFDFVEKRYPEIKSFAVEGARVLPKSIVEETNKKLEGYKGQAFTMETMAAIKNVIEGWYQARGFGLSYISHFTGMPTGNVVAHVNEGRTAKVGVVYVDEDGNPTQKKGSIPASFILKHCPVEVGTLYSMNDGRKTLQNVFALDLFDNVQVFPKQNEKDPSRVEVDVMVREKPLQTADVEMEWAVAPNDNNRPSLVSIVPGGTITYEHRNLGAEPARWRRLSTPRASSHRRRTWRTVWCTRSRSYTDWTTRRRPRSAEQCSTRGSCAASSPLGPQETRCRSCGSTGQAPRSRSRSSTRGIPPDRLDSSRRRSRRWTRTALCAPAACAPIPMASTLPTDRRPR
jgi:hypothetical protein